MHSAYFIHILPIWSSAEYNYIAGILIASMRLYPTSQRAEVSHRKAAAWHYHGGLAPHGVLPSLAGRDWLGTGRCDGWSVYRLPEFRDAVIL